MNYTKKSFKVTFGGKDYNEGWDRIFKNTESEPPPEAPEPEDEDDDIG